MNRLNLVSKRLHNHKLSLAKLNNPVDVVRWMGAVQAQDFNAAKWALALRMRAATNLAIEEAFNKGEILRTHVMRPTWHFVAPDDIRWLQQLTSARVNLRSGPNYRKLELDTSVFKRSNKVLTNALQGGKYLTRSALKAALNRAGIDAKDPVRLAHILLRAELDAVVCSGPRAGKQFTYALLEERVAPAKTFNREEALTEITRRYFKSHGPAMLQDFVWWSGLTVEDAKRGIAQVEREFEKETWDGRIYWGPHLSQTKLRYATHLLPAYDEYFVAYKDRQTVVHMKNGKPALTSWDVLGPTFIIDGIAAGTWKRTGSGPNEFNSSRELVKSEKLALSDAADRYSAFLG
jgi:hypothetical protein